MVTQEGYVSTSNYRARNPHLLSHRKERKRQSLPSLRVAEALAFVAIATAGCWILHWTSLLHVAIAGVVAVAWLGVIATKPCGRQWHFTHLFRARIQKAIFGALQGGACLLVVFAIAIGVPQMPAYAAWADRDRLEFQDQLESTVSQQGYVDASRLIERRLRNPISTGWQSELETILVEYLTLAGEQSPDPDAARGYLTKAVRLGKQFGVDTREAHDLLDKPEDSVSEVTRPRQLNGGEVTGGIRVADAEHSSGPLLELVVEEENTFLSGLRRRDFSVSINGVATSDFDVLEVDRSDAQSVNVLALLDHSRSTLNFRPTIHTAANQLVASCPDAVRFCVMTFADQATVETGWTRDHQEIEKAIASATGGQHTRLFGALEEAIEELRGRYGRRLIVLVGDGQSSEVNAGTSLAEVIRKCRLANVVVCCVGLEHAKARTETLQRLARETGGRYFGTSELDQVAKLFGRLKTQLSRPVYWLRVYERPIDTISVRVGSGPRALDLRL